MRQKSVLNMLNLRRSVVENDGNDIETGVHIQIVPEDISVGSSDQQALLLLVHRQIRVTSSSPSLAMMSISL